MSFKRLRDVDLPQYDITKLTTEARCMCCGQLVPPGLQPFHALICGIVGVHQQFGDAMGITQHVLNLLQARDAIKPSFFSDSTEGGIYGSTASLEKSDIVKVVGECEGPALCMGRKCVVRPTGNNKNNVFIEIGNKKFALCECSAHVKDPESVARIEAILATAAELQHITDNIDASNNALSPKCFFGVEKSGGCNNLCGSLLSMYSPKSEKKYYYCEIKCILKHLRELNTAKFAKVFVKNKSDADGGSGLNSSSAETSSITAL